MVCDYESSGCHWSGELRDLNTHIQRYCTTQKTKQAQNAQISQLQEELERLQRTHDMEVDKLRQKAARVQGIALVTFVYVVGVYLCKRYLAMMDPTTGDSYIVSGVLFAVCMLGCTHLFNDKT